MELTNWDIIYFFANKGGGKCPETQKLLNKIQKDTVRNEKHKDEPYVDFARSFKFFRMISGAGSVDKMFKSCKWLETLARNCELDVFLDGISLEEFYEKSYNPDFQRWHLIVSYYALTCFKETAGDVGKEDVFLTKHINALPTLQCPELLLWMYEVSAGEEIDKELLNEIDGKTAAEIKGRGKVRSNIVKTLRPEIYNAVLKRKNSIMPYIQFKEKFKEGSQ